MKKLCRDLGFGCVRRCHERLRRRQACGNNRNEGNYRRDRLDHDCQDPRYDQEAVINWPRTLLTGASQELSWLAPSLAILPCDGRFSPC